VARAGVIFAGIAGGDPGAADGGRGVTLGGRQKRLFPDELGLGRFETIGIPVPGVSGYFVGAVEIVCGTLVLLGLFTRFAAVSLIMLITVDLVATKIPIL
jgi:putative oxidoreductase